MTLFFLFCFLLSGQAISFLAFPSYKNVAVGDKIEPEFHVPHAVLKNISLHIESAQKSTSALNQSSTTNFCFAPGEVLPVADTPGTFNMQVKLFGVPVREMVVKVVPRVKVVPGGQSIGVLLHTNGVMVVGLADVANKDGKKENPAVKAGIAVGDVIVKINEIKVNSDAQVRDIVNRYGHDKKGLKLTIKRGKQNFNTDLKPVYCAETNRYRMGLFIRDSAAGVGTLSFYHPATGRYGALGHMIADIDTSKQIDPANGCVVGANIQSIHPGKKGHPGEKVGLFDSNSNIAGNITKNTRYGIFGRLEHPVKNSFYDQPIPVALSNEISEGPAQIFTVVKGSKVQKYDIEIQKVMPQSHSDGKGLIIKITDKKLLRDTGGIIQGMSGSPIIQKGRLVGAVTHVFINDPTRGYGVLAQWMLQEADIPLEEDVLSQKIDEAVNGLNFFYQRGKKFQIFNMQLGGDFLSPSNSKGYREKKGKII